ncbi:MAG: 30S ribosomal protein S20 [Candidatus Acetothermia bacterium]|nr:30S ribosomal protein S20 [Candidatus Acetothermia bacterium]
MAIPNTRSAKRQLRKSLAHRRRNDLRKSAVRFWRRKFQTLVEAGDKEEARKVLPQFQKAVDKAAARGVIHPNRAARLKARLSRRLKAA